MSTKLLRPYQVEAKQAVLDELQKKVSRQMIVMATGLGKTFTACNIAKDFKRCLWVSHTEELISQSAAALLFSEYTGDVKKLHEVSRKFAGFVEFTNAVIQHTRHSSFTSILNEIDYKQVYNLIGIVKRERMDLHAKIVVASVQTLYRRLDQINPDTFDLIVIDECHMAAAKTWDKCIEHFNPKLVLGLTATPYRTDGMMLSNIFDKIVYEYDILSGINAKFLCELEAIRVKTDLSLDSVRTTAGELNTKDLKIVDNPLRNRLIVDKYVEYANGRQAIVFCVDVEHAIHVSEEFAKRGLSASFVVGDTSICPDRQDRIRSFKDGGTTVMTNCMVLTAGFDHPEVGCIIMACPTKSKTKFVQCVGRGTRLKNEDYVFKYGQNCIILDMVDASSRHRLVNTKSLDEDKPIDEKVFITKAKKDQLNLNLKEKKERELKDHELKKKEKKVDLFKIPKVKVITSQRMQEPASEKQLAWIEKLGYDIVNITYTKAMCSEIISAQPASDKQKAALKYKGYAVPETLTTAEAQAAFNEIDEREGVEPKWKSEYKNRYNKFVAE